MKFKLITLVYILLIGSSCFSENIFLSGGFRISPLAQITSFADREVKLQPGINAGAFLQLNYAEYLNTGLSASYIYNRSSSIDGGWSYPGFSGIETTLASGLAVPSADFIEVGIDTGASWFKYNLTENYFFLPSLAARAAFTFYSDKNLELAAEIPVRYYFHRESYLFMSAGIILKAVVK